jgi:chromosome segregation protein
VSGPPNRPARLLSVRLQGFKSFAERTHVAFGPGISAVVGPNGSGKSNLADALRWALGEQGRALRSRKSEDVIWAGSERRAALGMADVQLVLDNADGLLPVEYGVVELGRRLYRSGENDYLLNRQRVRLRDLVDLLDAAHLAENAFLFIGQGMVDQALALRPEERRPLFEEVAGVRRHERRRRKAEEQLAESEANLARSEDILAELRPQARRLAAQAEQQTSRRSAGDELAAAILAAAHARWHAADGRVRVAVEAVATARTRLDRAMAELTVEEEAGAALSAKLALRATVEAERRAAVDAALAELTGLRLREGRVDSELANAARERARLDTERRAVEAERASAQLSLSEPPPARDLELDGELGEAERALAEALEELAAARRDVGADDADLAAVRRLEAARHAELDTARRRLAAAEQAAATEAERAAAATRDGATADDALAEARTALERAAAAEADAADTMQRAHDEGLAAQADAQSAGESESRLRSALASVRGSLSAAERAIADLEGGEFAVAAKAAGGERLDRDVVIDPDLRAAVDAALAGIGPAFLVDRATLARLAGQRGSAVVAESLATREAADSEADRRFEEAVRSRGGGLLRDALRRDDRGALRRLLERTAWLPDLGSCLELQGTMPAGWTLVPRDGSAAIRELVVTLGSDGGIIERQALAQRLSTEAARLAGDLAAAEQASAEATARAGTIAHALAAARATHAQATTTRRHAEERERAAARAAENAGRDASWLEAQASRLSADAERARAALPVAPQAGEASGATAAVAAGEEPAAHDEAALETWEQRAQDLRARRDRLAGLVAAAESRRQEADRKRAGAEAALGIGRSRLDGLDASGVAIVEREAGLHAERETLARLLAASVTREREARAELATLVAEDAGDRERLAAAEQGASRAREAVRVAQAGAQAGEREELEARLGLENVREQLLVELVGLGALALRHLKLVAAGEDPTAPIEPTFANAVSPAAAEAIVAGEALAADALAAEGLAAELEATLQDAAVAWSARTPPTDPPSAGRLASLRRRFHELGAGNPFAVDEYAALKTRLDALETQRLDLQAAIERTRSLIAELDTLIATQFRATFQALEVAFDARFQQLFGGGFARLSLTDPTDLSATGIEIVARPPGKKAQALAMLSGGERALTAVALLFAMLEVRPVPFCVLDEVDAALDEANIGRFTDALRELSQQTQCIVITHNRGTIETADALYGVTVGEDSVSRVISLRLEEATALAGPAGSNGSRSGTLAPTRS